MGVEIDAPPTSSHPDAAFEKVTDIVRRTRTSGSLDGSWKGTMIIEWQRVPVEIADRRLHIADLKTVSEPLARAHVHMTVNVMTVDLRVGDGVAFWSATSPEGLVFPMILQVLRPAGSALYSERGREGAGTLR